MRMTALITAFLLALIGLIRFAPAGFVTPPLFYNGTPSLPRGFYYVRKTDSLFVGDLVRVCVPLAWAGLARRRGYLRRGICPGGTTPVGKMVVARAGDTVVVSRQGIRVGDHMLSGSLPLLVDSKGRALKPAFGWHVLGSGECFVLSTLYRLSFDSRYLGPVRCETPHYVLQPSAQSSRHVLDSLRVAIRRDLDLH